MSFLSLTDTHERRRLLLNVNQIVAAYPTLDREATIVTTTGIQSDADGAPESEYYIVEEDLDTIAALWRRVGEAQ